MFFPVLKIVNFGDQNPDSQQIIILCRLSAYIPFYNFSYLNFHEEKLTSYNNS